MKQVNFRNIEISPERKILRNGGYVNQIKKVEDFPDIQCLKIYYDIYEGYYKNYFQDIYDKGKYWKGTIFVSYLEGKASIKYFYKFIEAIELSNDGFIFNYNEQELVGKLFGAVLIEEKLEKDGKWFTNNIVAKNVHNSFKSVNAIRNGDYIIDTNLRKSGIQSYKPYAKNGFIEEG